jgi:hypothetical protein
MQKDQTVSEMTEEVLVRQAKDLAHRSGRSLEEARQAVSDTEAGRQLKDLANGSIAMRRQRTGRWVFLGSRRGAMDAPSWFGGTLALCRRTPLL